MICRMNKASKAVAVFIFLSSAIFLSAQPANDSFANRTEITLAGTSATISGTLSNATFEADEPFVDGISSGQTAWWTWTAPSNGIVKLLAIGTNFSPFVTIYVGDDFTNLSLVASNNYVACYTETNCGCHWRERSELSLHVSAGRAYQVAIDSAIITDTTWLLESGSPDWGLWSSQQTTNVLPGGNLRLELSFTPAPRNDDFERPRLLTGARTHIVVSNEGATAQTNEPFHLGNPGGSSVWFRWKAPGSGRATLSTSEILPYSPPDWLSAGTYGVSIINLWSRGRPSCGTEIDQNPPPVFYPVFAAYTGGTLDSIVAAENCLPMNLDAYPNAVAFDAVKGQTYSIAFDGNMGTTETIPLYLALTTPARNDAFQHRIRTHGLSIKASGFNAGATLEPGESALPGATGKSVWWSWTAPASGTVSIETEGSDYDFPIGVFTGATLPGLSLVASGTGAISFEAEQGQRYEIAFQDAGGRTGAIAWTLHAPIVELPLLNVRVSGQRALLTYAASPHQVVLFQQSNDGVTWRNRVTAMPRRTSVSFFARPAPTDEGPFYRAIVVDYR